MDKLLKVRPEVSATIGADILKGHSRSTIQMLKICKVDGRKQNGRKPDLSEIWTPVLINLNVQISDEELY